MTEAVLGAVRQAAQHLAEFCAAYPLTPEQLATDLGAAGAAAIWRGEPAGARFACKRAGERGRVPLAVLVRDPFPAADAPLPQDLLDSLAKADMLQEVSPGLLQLQVDCRPLATPNGYRFLVSDPDAAMQGGIPGPDHVLGIGAASLSLLGATPTDSVPSMLDLGCGSGVQLLGVVNPDCQLTGIDIDPRATALAAGNLAAAGLAAQTTLATGSWFEPVKGQKFARIVSNPPFVVGTGQVGHTYRDSEFQLDGATKFVAQSMQEHLVPDGLAVMMGAWCHSEAEPWQARVASWFADQQDVEVWVVQRELVDVFTYVHTWLVDESLSPTSPEFNAAATRWLELFDQAGVTHVGMGFISIHNLDAAGRSASVVCEEITGPLYSPLGAEIAEYHQRMDFLRNLDRPEALLTGTFALRPGVAIERLDEATPPQGVQPTVVRVCRTDGPAFQVEIDEQIAVLLAGLHPQGLPLADQIELWTFATGIALETAAQEKQLATEIAQVMINLIRRGIVLPAALLAAEAEQ